MKCSFLLFIEALVALPGKERMGFEPANASLWHYWIETLYRECGSASLPARNQCRDLPLSASHSVGSTSPRPAGCGRRMSVCRKGKVHDIPL